ncbi:MAG: hypothetical protein WCI27_10660, partial [Candidatus Omnitrophota bacterium]
MSFNKQRLWKFVGLLVMVIGATGITAKPVFAEVTLEQLVRRLERLEQKNADLEQENAALKTAVAELRGRPSKQEVKPAADPAVPAASKASAENFLKTKGDVELYGYVKADAVFSSRDMGNAGTSITQYNAMRPTAAGGDDPESQMSAQDTRLGLKFKAPDLDQGGKLSGQFEMDFANSGANLSGNYTPR